MMMKMTFLKEYHRNHLNELWLIFAFTAALAFLIASSYMSAQFLQYGMPWSDLAAKNFSLSSLKKIPISDVAENLSSAIFIHNNLIVYDDFIINHLPGIPFLLSGFANLIGISSIVGGPETFYSLFYFSFFISAFVQLLFINLACRTYLGFSFLRLGAVSLVYGIYYLYYANFIAPLSEMWIIPLVFIAALQIFLYLNKQLSITNQELLICVFVIGCANYLGLTALPFFIIYGLIIGLAYFTSKPIFIDQPNQRALIIIPLGGMVAYFVMTLFFVDFKQLFYWNVNFNVSHSSLDFVNRIMSYVNYVMNNPRFFKFGQTAPIFAETNFYTLITIGLFIFLIRPSFKLVVVMAILVTSMHWRVIEGFKLYPMLGVVAAFLLTSQQKNTIVINKKWTVPPALYLTTLPLAAVAVFVISSLKFSIDYQSQLNTKYHACTLDADESHCSCFIQDFWQPDYFLKNNLLPCRQQFPSYPGAAGLTLGDTLEQFYDQHNLILRQQHPRLVDDLPTNIMDYYLRLRCEPFDSQSKLCVINNLAR